LREKGVFLPQADAVPFLIHSSEGHRLTAGTPSFHFFIRFAISGPASGASGAGAAIAWGEIPVIKLQKTNESQGPRDQIANVAPGLVLDLLVIAARLGFLDWDFPQAGRPRHKETAR
jgi:hypothetical protein